MKQLGWVVLALGVVAVYMAMVWAPEEVSMGDAQRIFYFHVPSAWNAYLSFFMVFVSSIAYLRTGKAIWDRRALCSAELGVFFTSMAIVSGAVWGRAVWGTWWTWDPRLTTTLFLWLIYVGYLVLHMTTTNDEKRGRLAAALGVIGFVDVPIIHMSVQWWRGLHPEVIRLGKMNMEPAMGITLLVAMVAFSLFYFYALDWRMKVEDLRARVAILKESLRV